MARPKTITDEALNAAAREVFVAHGPSAPVSRIAEKLGVSHAALFGRAGSKERLMMTALAPPQPRALQWLAEPPPQQRVRQRLQEILLDLMGFFHQVVPNLVVLRAAGHRMADLPSDGRTPPPVAIRRALADWLTRATREGSIEPLDPAAMAESLLGAMEARCFNEYLGGKPFAPGDDAAFIRGLVHALIKPRERGPR